MASMERIASLILLSLIAVMIVYPGLTLSQVSIEVEIESLEGVSLIELRLDELSIHHYGAGENNGRFPLIKEALVKTSGPNPEPYRCEAAIPYGSYDEIKMEISEAKVWVEGDEIRLDINQRVYEKNFSLTLSGEAYLKVKLIIDEGEILSNHVLSMDLEVASFK
ncbi:MAG: hypothetical protein QXE79_07680 [Candidatus Bathyarchaeia archaeon]